MSFVFFFHEKVVSKILPFRVDNKRFLDPIWNKHHIERVEIVLKETLDVKGDGKTCIFTVVIKFPEIKMSNKSNLFVYMPRPYSLL